MPNRLEFYAANAKLNLIPLADKFKNSRESANKLYHPSIHTTNIRRAPNKMLVQNQRNVTL